jgi:hypothetical protein
LGGVGCVLICVGACSGGVDSSCGSYFDALNAYLSQCSTSTLGFVFDLDASERAAFLQECDAIAKAPGTSNFADQVSTCASAVRSSTSSCSSSLDCSFRGTLADGSACGSSVQCSGGVCDTSGTMPNPMSELQCGVCASFAPIGGSCTTASCDGSTSSCTDGTCVAYISAGGACGGNVSTCAPGLECNGATCGSPPTKGQACTLECHSPYLCINMTCADAVGQGGACPVGNECATNLTCDPQSHTCVTPTLAQLGQACGVINNQVVDCASGLNCTTQICTAPLAAGAACTVGKGQCGAFLDCISGTCQVPDLTVCN